MSSRFVHLHAHSHYSLLSALPKIDELVGEAAKLGMDALALTDNGNLYGAIDFYKACRKKGVKPIIGVDFYVAARGRKDMQAGIDNRRSRLVLLATNLAGYKNLLKLVTNSNLEGFYYRPRIDRERVAQRRLGRRDGVRVAEPIALDFHRGFDGSVHAGRFPYRPPRAALLMTIGPFVAVSTEKAREAAST